MAELFNVLTVEEARAAIARHLPDKWPSVKAPILQSLGRRLAVEVRAVDDVPGFDRSTMDGFAVRAKDSYGATEGMPSYVDISGEVIIGRRPEGEIRAGQAYHIPTGGMLPPGADAVVMVEYTEELDSSTIGIIKPVAPGENVVRRGDDIAAGEIALPAGHLIRPQDLGMLSSIGVTEVEVAVSVKVGIVSTGDELVDPGAIPSSGQVRDINSHALYGAVTACGGEPRLYGIIVDNYGKLKDALEIALEENHMVLLSGGSSVGTRDVASKVIDSAGRPGVLFHGIAVSPGKPTVGAILGGKPVFGLPGHPASAMVIFDLMVAPLLRTGGYPANEKESAIEFPLRVVMTRNIRSAAGREDFIRVKLFHREGQFFAEPVLGKSGLISTMVRADGLARIPAGKEGIEAGEIVEVKLF